MPSCTLHHSDKYAIYNGPKRSRSQYNVLSNPLYGHRFVPVYQLRLFKYSFNVVGVFDLLKSIEEHMAHFGRDTKTQEHKNTNE